MTDSTFWLVKLALGPVAGVLGGLVGSLPFSKTPLAQRLGLAIGTILSVLLSQFDTRVIGGGALISGVPLSKALDPFALSVVSALTIGAVLKLFGQEYLRPGRGRIRQSGVNSSIFLSYRRADSLDVTGRLYEHLTRELPGLKVFRDFDSIQLGADFRSAINAAMAACRVCLVVIGPNWLTLQEQGQRRIDAPEDQVRQEIERAKANGLVIIPVLVSGAAMLKEEDLPASIKFLAFRNAAIVRPDPDFKHDVDRLIEGIGNCM